MLDCILLNPLWQQVGVLKVIHTLEAFIKNPTNYKGNKFSVTCRGAQTQHT